MEAVSLVGSALIVIDGTKSVAERWQTLLDGKVGTPLSCDERERYRRNVERLQTAASLLSAFSHNLPVNKLPDGAFQGLRSCQVSLSSTEEVVSEIETLMNQGVRKSLSKALKMHEGLPALVDHFVSSVDLFRGFCQESQTRYIIESMQNVSANLSVLQMDIRASFEQLRSDTTRLIDDQGGVYGEEERVALVRQQFEKIQSHQTTYQFNTTDEYVFTITVVNGAAPAVAQLTLDSGCGDNWVSLRLIEKAGLTSMIEDVDDANLDSQCQTFSGHALTSLGSITLEWVASHTEYRRTYEETFQVHDQLPVDMVAGRGFMHQEYLFVEKYALGQIRLGRLPPAEILKMQASAKEKGVENSKIADMRRAQDAAKRQARRAHNAASRAATGGANTPYHPSSGLQTPVSNSLRRLSVETFTNSSTSRAPSDPEATGSAVESSRGDSLGTSSTADDPVPQTEECLVSIHA